MVKKPLSRKDALHDMVEILRRSGNSIREIAEILKEARLLEFDKNWVVRGYGEKLQANKVPGL